MSKLNLSQSEIVILRKLHKNCKDKNACYKLNAIILLAKGYTYQQVKTVLLLDESTIRRYEKKFLDNGEEVLLANNHKGKKCKLTQEQLDELAEYMENHLFSNAMEIANYVKKEFAVEYKQESMVKVVKKLGFSYKKTKLVPAKANKEEQEKFVEMYENLRSNLKSDEKLYFMDAVHPTHNTMPANAWIKTGTNKEIKSNTGRKRVNINGAYSPIDSEIITLDEERVNSDSVIRLYEKIEKKHRKLSKIYMIGDNARYNYSKKVREYLKTSRIIFVPLPTYSPNLNLIERLWLFLKKNVLYNRYYEKFDDFKNALFHFLSFGIKQKKDELKSLMTENFHLMGA
jgi:transposase